MTESNHTHIELLSPIVVKDHPKYAGTVDTLRKGLIMEIGWHYWVDLTWILATLDKLNIPKGSTILDAGAGYGLLQFLLAFSGYNVISVDYSVRKARFLQKTIFPMEELSSKSDFSHAYINQIKEFNRLNYHPKRLISFLKRNWDSIFWYFHLLGGAKLKGNKPGKITLYRADIKNMGEISDSTIDAVVSCSVIEHLEFNDIPKAIEEFTRVLKPGKPMLITTSASKESDWFDKNGFGWCFSRKTLSNIFENTIDPACDFNDYDLILNQYLQAKELKKRLSSSYFVSDTNGMPWGIWDPKYLPVGIIKRNNSVSAR